jgi:phage-related baseplate assembly protein
MSNENPIFLEYDAEQEEQKLVKLFEDLTGRTLYPAQDERLLISIIEYKAALLVNLFNEAAKLNLTQYSKGAILDCIGTMFGTPRLEGEYGTGTLKITLNTTFSSDLTIEKGLEILSKDEKFSFVTTENCIINAGETIGQVKIQSLNKTSDVNNYGIGDINILIKPISYIQSVSNISPITSGSDIEKDDAYIKRILLSSEKFTCAGSRQSYIYHTLSANTKIIDATAESVEQPATVKIGSTLYEEDNGQIITPSFTVSLNHKLGQFNFTLNNVDYTFKMPPDTTVNIYPLTDDDETPNNILEDVETLLNGETVNPMTDKIIVSSPIKKQKTITLNIQLEEKADYDEVSQKINNAVNEYKKNMRKKLNSEIVPSQIISKIGSIDGIYSVDTGNLNLCTANMNEYFDLNFILNITQ